jgi:hypothetical protein
VQTRDPGRPRCELVIREKHVGHESQHQRKDRRRRAG